VRRRLVMAAGSRGLPGGFEFCMGLLEDLRTRDPDALHRFLWANHLGYAQTYEVHRRFGASNINPTRHLLFRKLTNHLSSQGVDPRRDICSVFEVGCSMGYLLRHMEEQVFPGAHTLHGLDIDARAIETGTAHLNSLRSKVQLFQADMLAAAQIMADRKYDIVLCCGTLMYVNTEAAQSILRAMFTHATRAVGLICLAPSGPDSGHTEVRTSDGAFVHHIEPMINLAGGRLLSSEWVGTHTSGSSPSHVIVAEATRGAAGPDGI
jgi:SAM-dependent methyltransferase